MPWTACPVHRIGLFHIVQELQSDQGSTRSSTPPPPSAGEETLEHCQLLSTSSSQPSPLSIPPPRLHPAGGSIKIICCGFYEQRSLFKTTTTQGPCVALG